MPLVVFMRAVNLGGHNTFRPSVLAKELAHLGLINIGAAGTFVVPGSVAQGVVRTQLQKALPFPVELMICPARAVLDLAATPVFAAGPRPGFRHYVSVLSRTPRKRLPLPFSQPPGERWEVKVVMVSGKFALSLFRRLGKTFVDPNAVVEKKLGLRATTRNRSTILKICDLLRA
jgi:uncharacterized protein (DUF1697 family)